MCRYKGDQEFKVFAMEDYVLFDNRGGNMVIISDILIRNMLALGHICKKFIIGNPDNVKDEKDYENEMITTLCNYIFYYIKLCTYSNLLLFVIYFIMS